MLHSRACGSRGSLSTSNSVPAGPTLRGSSSQGGRPESGRMTYAAYADDATTYISSTTYGPGYS